MNTVLIVDDEVRFLQSIEAGLASYADRFKVLTATNGRSAVALLEQQKIDLLVTDLRMPEMDGFALLAHVSVSCPFLPAIVMTAFATPELEEKINSTGSAKLLEKPVAFEKLAEAIQEGLQQESKEGSVAGFSLANFLQLLSMEQKTCLLNVRNSQTDGFIYLEQGDVAAAVAGNLKGEEAFFHLLGCDNVRLTFKKLPQKKIARVIHKPLIPLLMEGMCRLDEAGQHPQHPAGEELGQHRPPPPSDEPGKDTAIQSPHGGQIMSKIEDTLNKLSEIEGFMAVGVFTPNGEMAAQVTTSNVKLVEIGSLANDVLLKAQKATDLMNVGRGQIVHIEAPKAHIIARCLNEAEDFSDTQAGKAHIHLVLLLSKDANLAMGKIKLESIIHQVAESFR
jgi:CheY-like chemotaxis protein/predicted regulator of Ras-like GTPase activity (Roadblock/LC7/MglB family)